MYNNANEIKFHDIYIRWSIEKIVVFVVIAIFALIIFLTEIFIDNKPIWVTVIACIIILYRLVIDTVKNVRLLNHIVHSVSGDDIVSIDTFKVSVLFGLKKIKPIHVDFSKSDVKVYDATSTQPFNQRILRSQENYVLESQGKYFFSIRGLFEDEILFNRFINSIKA